MRVLHTRTRSLQRVDPWSQYCILSHRWNEDPDEEPSFQDASTGNWRTWSTGYAKLEGACRLAQSLGYDWIWIDTCCIDKTNNVELSESLKSMFRWYMNAAVCLTYLADVDDDDEFDQSVWWTRGWTLQELIAPSDLRFYNSAFEPLGTKNTRADQVAKITGIEKKYFLKKNAFKEASVAARFSWAAHRELTRKEDEAWCLLGLMEVFIDASYGEGDNAFFRLQKEIMANSDDESIFAWFSPNADASMAYGLLASSPRDFANSGDVTSIVIPSGKRSPYRWTQKGVEIKRKHGGISGKPDGLTDLAIACTALNAHGQKRIIYIRLCRMRGQYYRIDVDGFLLAHSDKDITKAVAGGWMGREETFYVVQPTGHRPLELDTTEATQKHKANANRAMLASLATIAVGLGGIAYDVHKQRKARREAESVYAYGEMDDASQYDPQYSQSRSPLTQEYAPSSLAYSKKGRPPYYNTASSSSSGNRRPEPYQYTNGYGNSYNGGYNNGYSDGYSGYGGAYYGR